MDVKPESIRYGVRGRGTGAEIGSADQGSIAVRQEAGVDMINFFKYEYMFIL